MAFDVSNIASAGERSILQLDAVANNLANSSTPGFKSEQVFYGIMKEATQQEIGNSNPSAPPSLQYNSQPRKIVDLSQGVLMKTGNTLDMAIEGKGFFCIQQKTGISYTRNGSFTINKDNELVTGNGLSVLGESGPIKISGKSIEIDSDGNIIADGNIAGKLRIVVFKKPGELTRAGDGQYIDEGNAEQSAADKYRVAGGYLESSNVNPVKEMIKLINIQRYDLETYQKVIQTLSDLDKISTSRLGKLI
jgi:flagellar basal-body rod protein FlgF